MALAVLEFRAGSFKLPTNRRSRGEADVKLCKCGRAVGNENHFLFHCPLLGELRVRYLPASEFQTIKSVIADVTIETAIFIRKGLELLS